MNRHHCLFIAIVSAIAAPPVQAAAPAPPASAKGAQQLTVNALGDAGDGVCDIAPGDCTLRDAFESAAADGVASAIIFDPTLQGQTISLSEGELTIIDDTLSVIGGGVVIQRDTSVACQLDSDAAPGEFRLIRAETSDLTLSDVTLQEGCVDTVSNEGGALRIIDSNLTLSNVTVQDSVATDRGAGIFFYAPAGGRTLAIENSTFRRNAGFKGGGVYFLGDELTIARSTFSSNSVTSGGGGLAAYGASGTALVTDSTFSGNACIDGGGGVLMSIDGQVIASTFVDNTSYGADDVRTGYGNTLTVSGSILASSEACAPGNLPTGSNNLTLSSTCASIATEVSEAELKLGPLADNGGPTLTHLPGITSVAVDTGGDCGRTIDQRGLPGQVDADGAGSALCDVGAVELQAGEGDEVFANGFETTNE